VKEGHVMKWGEGFEGKLLAIMEEFKSHPDESTQYIRMIKKLIFSELYLNW
jgi:hypothetical protein